MHDVVVVGGGVIGLSLAYELALRGVAVAVFDQGPLAQEASWAGAGMLPPGNPARAITPEARLRAGSHVLWPALSERLLTETGVDNGFRRCGGLEVRWSGIPDELAAEAHELANEGIVVERLSPAELLRHEAALRPDLSSGYRLPELGQVRNPRHTKALIAACVRHGVELFPGTPVHGFQSSGEMISAVRTAAGDVPAGQFVVTSGAWSSGLLSEFVPCLSVVPVRGQIVLLNVRPGLLRHVINVGSRYLVPRPDGRLLVGSSEEWAGFEKRTTAEIIKSLLDFACELVPELAEASLEKTWAGLRPHTADGLPYLGAVPEVANLYVAAGHFRAGLQLSPITAQLLTEVMLDNSPRLDLTPYRVDRPRVVATAALPVSWE